MIIDRDDRMVFTEELRHRRRGGRPRGVPVVTTSVKLPEPVFDALCQVAHRHDESLHATMKKALKVYAQMEGCHGFK